VGFELIMQGEAKMPLVLKGWCQPYLYIHPVSQ